MWKETFTIIQSMAYNTKYLKLDPNPTLLKLKLKQTEKQYKFVLTRRRLSQNKRLCTDHFILLIIIMPE